MPPHSARPQPAPSPRTPTPPTRRATGRRKCSGIPRDRGLATEVGASRSPAAARCGRMDGWARRLQGQSGQPQVLAAPGRPSFLEEPLPPTLRVPTQEVAAEPRAGSAQLWPVARSLAGAGRGVRRSEPGRRRPGRADRALEIPGCPEPNSDGWRRGRA